ncbi:GNAT family N-acetyltransferase [Nocardioides sp. CPCC 205120]|uniref:GNAT family N-acetyltransferase n=1 Tax=Nocardioides sp. CPCC 205120 TaxID=3406462 RepID=UPI003B50B04F
MTPGPLVDVLPTADLVVRAGRLELRAVTDDVLGPLGRLAAAGIHADDAMPFDVPWSVAPPAELPRRVAQFHWGVRARFSAEEWDLELTAYWDGGLVGCQGFSTRRFLLTRTGGTGSWLGRAHQGRGIGTAMRRAMCVLALDHLGATEVTSGAYADNRASLAVSRKVGYVVDGTSRVVRVRAGVEEVVARHRLVVTPATLVRGDAPVEVAGLAPVRAAVGLPPVRWPG